MLMTIFAILTAMIHLYIFYLEVIAFGSPKFQKTFVTKSEHHDIIRPAFNNLGVYNLALGSFFFG